MLSSIWFSAGWSIPEAQPGPSAAFELLAGAFPSTQGQAFSKTCFFSMKIHPQIGVGGAELRAWKRGLEKLRFDV